MALPIHPDQFEADWLAEKLKGGAIKGWRTTQIGTGQASDSFRLELDWAAPSQTAPASIVAKCPAADADSRNAAKTFRNYELEIFWYRNFAAQISIRTPHCYFTEINEDCTEFVLLLEDLAPAKQGDQIKGADANLVGKILDEAARLHAFGWNDPALDDVVSLNTHKEFSEFAGGFVSQIFPEWRARYQDRLASHVLALCDEMIENIEAVIRRYEGGVRALTHCDLRLDNILYPDRADRVIVVDWQTIQQTMPLLDVGYCLGTTIVEPETRAAVEEECVRAYFERLCAQGVSDYAWAQCWHDYRLSPFHGLLTAIIAGDDGRAHKARR